MSGRAQPLPATAVLGTLAPVDLVGRDEDRAEIARRLAGPSRVVTIIGPGGVGKTSLALDLLEELGPSFELGGHLVDLSRIDRPDAVAGAVAAQLGFASFDGLLGAPSEQPALVVVDNCEHVIEAAATTVHELVRNCRSPVVLATSRSPLAIPDESVVVIGPLALPEVGSTDVDAGAVRLFLERARQAGAVVEDDDVEVVAELCRRLDGLPLAIEIAAARARALGIDRVAERLAGGIDVLDRPRFHGAARHRSLRATVEWSYDLLDDEAKRALDRLGVLIGPFSFEHGSAVTSDGGPGAAVDADRWVEVLDRLVDASLVVPVRGSLGTRYRLLDTVRAVALDHLSARGELDEARDRFAAVVLETVADRLAVSRDRWEAVLVAELLELFDDIDAALRWSLDHDDDPTRAFLLTCALWGAVHQARVDEILELASLVVDRWPDLSVPLAADAAATLAMALHLCGRADDAVALATDALAEVDGLLFAPVSLRRVLALAARARGDHAESAERFAEAADAASATGVATMAMECAAFRAQDLAALGQVDDALVIARTVALDASRARSPINEVWARTVEGAILLEAGDLAASEPVVLAALAASRQMAYPFGTIANLHTLVACRLEAATVRAAADAAIELLDAVARSGAGDLRLALERAALVLDRAGRDEAGAAAAFAARLPSTNPMAFTPPAGLPSTARVESVPPGAADRAAAVRLARGALVEVAGMPADDDAMPPSEPVPATHGIDEWAGTQRGSFVRTGDLVEVTFRSTTVRVKATKGMDDLAVLLERPGAEVHCLDLVGAGVDEAPAGDAIDATARRQYEDRVRELQAEIDDADSNADLGRADRARVELDALVDHLTAALGLGGAARPQGGTAARARSAVTHRIRAAIRRLAEADPVLGRHLAASISTGTFCSYRPEVPTTWQT